MAVVVGDGVTASGAAVIAVEAAKACAIRTLKITGGCAPGSGVDGTGIVIFAGRLAVSVANLASLNQIILTDRDTVVVVKAIAPRSATAISACASGHRNVGAKSIAGGSCPSERVRGACVGIVTGGRTITITDFISF